MQSSLADVEFLVRSESRVEVLEALAESPRTREELGNATEASRTTLSRMIADFEDRDWLRRPDRAYHLTSEGEFVANEMTRLLENMEAAERLDGTLEWLPTDEFEFDLRHLSDADVVTLQWNDPATMRQLAGLLDGADDVKSIASAVSREVADMLQQVTVESDASYEGILTQQAVDIIREHPELREQLRTITESEDTTLYRYAGDDTPAMVMCIDDQATICNHASGGPEMEAVLSEADAFRSWVESYFDTIRDDAEEIHADVFAP